MKISCNEIKPGMIIEHKNDFWSVLKTQHVKPGKGGAFNQVELKSVTKGTKLNERFRSSDTVEKADVDQRKFNYLYSDKDFCYLMNSKDFEQISVPYSLFGEKINLLSENLEIDLTFLDEKPISVELPINLEFEVESTEAVVKGQTAAPSYKPAKIKDGITVMVPPFIGDGDKIIIDTRTLEYVKKSN